MQGIVTVGILSVITYFVCKLFKLPNKILYSFIGVGIVCVIIMSLGIL